MWPAIPMVGASDDCRKIAAAQAHIAQFPIVELIELADLGRCPMACRQSGRTPIPDSICTAILLPRGVGLPYDVISLWAYKGADERGDVSLHEGVVRPLALSGGVATCCPN
jgi:hypothetical protein